jgi:signal transduction histidine kinase
VAAPTGLWSRIVMPVRKRSPKNVISDLVVALHAKPSRCANYSWQVAAPPTLPSCRGTLRVGLKAPQRYCGMRASIFEKGQGLRLSRDGLVSSTWSRSIGIAAAVGVAYFLAAELSNSFLITPETVIFWPAAGISSGLLISLWSIARWPVLAGVMIATAAANLLRHFGVATTAVWVLGNTAEPLIIAGLTQYLFGANFKIDRLYCVLGLFATAVAGTAVASTWWTFVYYWLFASLNEPAATWLHWIVSDFAGIVSVAPLVIGIVAALRRPPAWRETIESLAALAVLGAMSGVIVSLPLGLWETVVPAALVFPILLWLAARWRPVFSAAGAFIVSMSVALTAIYGLGHFSDSGLSIGARVLQTQAIILVVAFGTTVLAALFAERRESEARLASANTMLEHERERLAHSNLMLQRERDNKLMSLQAVMASISHEIKQPLSAIAINGGAAQDFLKSAPPDLAEAQSALDDVIGDSHRTGQILDNLHQLFGREEQENEPIDMNDLARSSLQLLRREVADHGVAPALDLAAELPLVMGQKTQLQEVLLNLFHNAFEAMVAVKTDRRTLKVRTALAAGKTIIIEIEDSGSGINPERLESIFEAFVTTKSRGMGLGLAISSAIVVRHGGQLLASSDGKSGALFKVVLPVASARMDNVTP